MTMTNRRTGHKARRNTTSPIHKFPVGACVFHHGGVPGVEGAVFRVTRLLPDGGEGLQYRLKGEHDGQERVSTEACLKPVQSH